MYKYLCIGFMSPRRVITKSCSLWLMIRKSGLNLDKCVFHQDIYMCVVVAFACVRICILCMFMSVCGDTLLMFVTTAGVLCVGNDANIQRMRYISWFLRRSGGPSVVFE